MRSVSIKGSFSFSILAVLACLFLNFSIQSAHAEADCGGSCVSNSGDACGPNICAAAAMIGGARTCQEFANSGCVWQQRTRVTIPGSCTSTKSDSYNQGICASAGMSHNPAYCQSYSYNGCVWTPETSTCQ
jgi:hypothetical protein